MFAKNIPMNQWAEYDNSVCYFDTVQYLCIPGQQQLWFTSRYCLLSNNQKQWTWKWKRIFSILFNTVL